MLIRTLVAAACCLMPLASALPAQAEEAAPLGYSAGADPVLWQFVSAVHMRGNPWGEYTESILSLITRNQVLSQDRTYAIDTFGLGVALGLNLWNFRAGLAGEVDWFKRVQMVTGTNQLEFANGIGFLVEPYVAVPLPLLKTPFTQTEIALHWPIIRPDPAIGPRVMATIWLGPGPEDEAAEEEEPAPMDEESLEEELQQMEQEVEEQLRREDAEEAPAPSRQPDKK